MGNFRDARSGFRVPSILTLHRENEKILLFPGDDSPTMMTRQALAGAALRKIRSEASAGVTHAPTTNTP